MLFSLQWNCSFHINVSYSSIQIPLNEMVLTLINAILVYLLLMGLGLGLNLGLGLGLGLNLNS